MDKILTVLHTWFAEISIAQAAPSRAYSEEPPPCNEESSFKCFIHRKFFLSRMLQGFCETCKAKTDKRSQDPNMFAETFYIDEIISELHTLAKKTLPPNRTSIRSIDEAQLLVECQGNLFKA